MTEWPLAVFRPSSLATARWNSSGSLLAQAFSNDVVVIDSILLGGDGPVSAMPLGDKLFQNPRALDWRPETNWLAGADYERLVFWNGESGALVTTGVPVPDGSSLKWSPDGQLLSVNRRDEASTVYRVPADLKQPVDEVARFAGTREEVGWSPDSASFAFVDRDGAITVFHLPSGAARTGPRFDGPTPGPVRWSPTGQVLAIPDLNGIYLAEPSLEAPLTALRGHTHTVANVAFSSDGRLLASVGQDGTLCLWAVDDWRLAATIEAAKSNAMLLGREVGLSFHPWVPLLCSAGLKGGASLYELDIEGLLGAPAAPVKRYTTAKVVLVGESGVGKTGLGYRMATGEFKEHASTHGQQFWLLDSLAPPRSDGARCEVVLWDLAGQPDYRLIHVLFLDDADAAIVVLDAAQRHELLDVVGFWLKALEAARPGCVKILVAGRTDRGNPAVSAQELRAYAERFGVEAGFIETSALTGVGLAELTAAFQKHIRWDDLPLVVETPALNLVRAEVLRLKERDAAGVPLVPLLDLWRRLAGQATEAEIAASIRDLQVRGFVHVLRAADGARFVLLRPELLNNLAASFVLEARRNERGLGALDEAGAFAARYRFSELDGLPEEQRRVLIEAAIVLFLEHNVCFREPLGDQVLLIFPELINEKPPALADTDRFVDEVTYQVTGSIENVYASLVVLLGYTNVLRRRDQWRDQARYEMDGHLLHFKQVRPSDDQLKIVLSYNKGVPDSAKQVFQGLVELFLRRRQVSVRKYLRVACPECRYVLPQAQVIQFVDEAQGFTYCPRSGHRILLATQSEQVAHLEQEQPVLRAEAAAAAERTKFAVAATQLRRYLVEVADRPGPLTVFISYPWGDRATEGWVRDQLTPDLKQAGITVVLDRATNKVGDNLARFVEQADAADRVLVVATPAYGQKYRNPDRSVVAAEAEVINLRLLGAPERTTTVLPVLLAGKPEESLPPLLRTRIHADFRNRDRYFTELFELILALHGLAPGLPALKELRESLASDRDR